MFQVLKHDVSRVSFECYLQTWGNMLQTFANPGPRSGLRLFWSLSVSLLFSLLRDSSFRKDRQIRQSHRIHFLNVHRFIKFLFYSFLSVSTHLHTRWKLDVPPWLFTQISSGLAEAHFKKGRRHLLRGVEGPGFGAATLLGRSHKTRFLRCKLKFCLWHPLRCFTKLT